MKKPFYLCLSWYVVAIILLITWQFSKETSYLYVGLITVFVGICLSMYYQSVENPKLEKKKI